MTKLEAGSTTRQSIFRIDSTEIIHHGQRSDTPIWELSSKHRRGPFVDTSHVVATFVETSGSGQLSTIYRAIF